MFFTDGYCSHTVRYEWTFVSGTTIGGNFNAYKLLEFTTPSNIQVGLLMAQLWEALALVHIYAVTFHEAH
jgi:hypothetical protein